MINYLIIIIFILLSAIFSGLEIAFVTSDKLRLEIDNKQGKWYATMITRFLKSPKMLLATFIIGNNIVLVIYGILSAHMLEESIGKFVQNTFILLIIQTVISSLIILIFGEFLPKALFRLKANKLLYLFTLPILFLYYLLYPITIFFISFSNGITRLFFPKQYQKHPEIIFSKADIQELIRLNLENTHTNNDHSYELKIFHNALKFDKVKIKECMVPRTEIAAISVTSSIQEAKEIFIETGYSKLVVYQENIDNVIGYIHIGDLFNNPSDIKNVIRDIIIAPETLPAHKLLKEFFQKKKSIAVIVDEFGGTSGIVTIEDILEEIFGEINDEHDTNDFIEKKINDAEYLFSGRLEIDYINEKYQLNIPTSTEYETLAGYILYYHQSLPKNNEVINLNPFQIKIIKSTNTKIDLVLLKKLPNDV